MPHSGCSTALTGVLPHTFAVFMKPLQCSSTSLEALPQHYLGVSSTKLFVKNQYIVPILSQSNAIYVNANSSFLLKKCVSSIASVTICDAVKVHPLTAFSRSDPLCNVTRLKIVLMCKGSLTGIKWVEKTKPVQS